MLIKRADADAVAKEAVSLNLGDLEREGAELVADARTRVDMILARGRAERDRIVAGASERGYKSGLARGHEEGLAQGLEKGEAQALEHTSAAISSLVEQWGIALDRFEADRERMLSEARADVLRLATVFAERVTRRALALDGETIERSLDAALRRVVDSSAVTIVVHPDDYEVAQRLLPVLMDRIGGSAHGAVAADASLTRGGCIVRTESGGIINADVDAMIDRMVDALLPGVAVQDLVEVSDHETPHDAGGEAETSEAEHAAIDSAAVEEAEQTEGLEDQPSAEHADDWPNDANDANDADDAEDDG